MRQKVSNEQLQLEETFKHDTRDPKTVQTSKSDIWNIVMMQRKGNNEYGGSSKKKKERGEEETSDRKYQKSRGIDILI